jgi:anti-sigma28 factor (negative regulator of flagellin synthesis)
MTIVEKNGIDGQWLFRTQPLQTGQTQSKREISLELAPPPTPVATIGHNHAITQHAQQQLQRHHHHHHQQQPQQQKQHQQLSQVQTTAAFTQQNQQQQRLQQIENVRPRVPTGPIPIDPKKVVKSSTAPNLHTSTSLSEMFRVI